MQHTLIGHYWRVRIDSTNEIIFECAGLPKKIVYNISEDMKWRFMQGKQKADDNDAT